MPILDYPSSLIRRLRRAHWRTATHRPPGAHFSKSPIIVLVRAAAARVRSARATRRHASRARAPSAVTCSGHSSATRLHSSRNALSCLRCEILRRATHKSVAFWEFRTALRSWRATRDWKSRQVMRREEATARPPTALPAATITQRASDFRELKSATRLVAVAERSL